jgi:hypothetical protein
MEYRTSGIGKHLYKIFRNIFVYNKFEYYDIYDNDGFKNTLNRMKYDKFIRLKKYYDMRFSIMQVYIGEAYKKKDL